MAERHTGFSPSLVRPMQFRNPAGGFLLYRRTRSDEVSAFAERPTSAAEISRILAKLWRNESSETKARYRALSERLPSEAAHAYPIYHIPLRRQIMGREGEKKAVGIFARL
ncbi:hypothetical protein BX616_010135 [Lobosporangium transversale]|uniref:HMG box domain-containing protein n=1 Tax=Lobosporangium transversale TaxID=64571 RepID=A0A1Y2GP78_9FUNG|nr:hypothetical protein BCR41DRAFT_395780 [Lobosporangium transversale]KAF9913220.1 hypothetical protein BX616_010135 [Lobosporangium transversale]ORZ17498.1 hypothetical protein BCR41DRAFT_395780 [Lobosporangium transversale]|eukprot:XP_021881885.1 hypothetical protein BCR41DRAFT_395780 [Lobosporangium transversale]